MNYHGRAPQVTSTQKGKICAPVECSFTLAEPRQDVPTDFDNSWDEWEGDIKKYIYCSLYFSIFLLAPMEHYE